VIRPELPSLPNHKTVDMHNLRRNKERFVIKYQSQTVNIHTYFPSVGPIIGQRGFYLLWTIERAGIRP
jgi:hypothetical protein